MVGTVSQQELLYVVSQQLFSCVRHDPNPTPTPAHQHQTQPAEHVPGLSVTLASDTRIPPALADNAGPPTIQLIRDPRLKFRTVFITPNPKRGSSPLRPRNGDEDVLSSY
jgi:hypothetical protein